MKKYLIGAVDIGGTKIQVGLVDDAGRILGEDSFPTNSRTRPGMEMAEKICAILNALCAENGAVAGDLRGIGIFSAGPVDPVKGTIDNPYTLPGWQGFPLTETLEKLCGVPVKLDNDANGALLGEVLCRKLQKAYVLMVTVGTGVGTAVWTGGDVFRRGKYHPEMGHVAVRPDGPGCYCGRAGCFESLCSGKALNDRAAAAGFGDFDGLYAARDDNDAAKALLEEMRQDFKTGIWNLCVIFKPEYLILAGGFAKRYFPWLKEAVLEDLAGKEDFVEPLCVLPTAEQKNAALSAAAMVF